MHGVSIVGVDLAKQVFQVHGATVDGRVLFRKKLSRPQFAKFMAALGRCRLRVALVDRWQVLQPVEALGLKPALPFDGMDGSPTPGTGSG